MINIGDYVMVRTETAGVFAGTLTERVGREVHLTYARRIWYWAGAASLSELAVLGTIEPNECKFPVEVSEVILLDAVEILLITETAKRSIASVPIWSAIN